MNGATSGIGHLADIEGLPSMSAPGGIADMAGCTAAPEKA
jgi:hypothetical protein